MSKRLTAWESEVVQLVGVELLSAKEIASRKHKRPATVHSTIIRAALKLPPNEGTTPVRQIIAHCRPLRAA